MNKINFEFRKKDNKLISKREREIGRLNTVSGDSDSSGLELKSRQVDPNPLSARVSNSSNTN